MSTGEITSVLRLVPIEESGAPADGSLRLDDVGRDVCAATATLYGKAGFVKPWVGYLLVEGDRVVGTCAFKSPPVAGEVEIAYFTFAGNEGRGLATRMARDLVGIARSAGPEITVTAQTLPAKSASTSILLKLGFTLRRTLVHPEDGEIWEWELRPSGAPS